MGDVCNEPRFDLDPELEPALAGGDDIVRYGNTCIAINKRNETFERTGFLFQMSLKIVRYYITDLVQRYQHSKPQRSLRTITRVQTA